jgi:hypothetical protein
MGKTDTTNSQEFERRLTDAPVRSDPPAEPRDQQPTSNADTKPVIIVEPKTRSHRRVTGPQTATGKQRSSLNAQKHGIFSTGFLVGDESPREFKLLLGGLREDLQPEGALETTLVEKLAWNLWKQRRVHRAEAAEIEDAIQFSPTDAQMDLRAEAWDCERSGEKSGGMLRNIKNPYVLEKAIELLRTFRLSLEHFGFQKDPWLLRKLYGLDHDLGVPWGLYKMYVSFGDALAENAKENSSADSAEALKKTMLGILDLEIERFEKLRKLQQLADAGRIAYKRDAAFVPPPAVLERVLRYESHLSREFAKALADFERLQRKRLGQPVVPPINVQICE